MEQKRFDKKNWLVIAAVALLIVVAGAIAAVVRPRMAPVEENTRAYLVVEVAGQMYEPMLLEVDGKFTITRGEMVNVVAVTKDSVTMHSSTCDNQDCVLQGVVSLENRADRVLQNMILCLPHEIVLALYTEEEVKANGWPTAEVADE